MSLSQKKYANGRLYISGITENGKLTGIDIRFFKDEDDGLLPTRKGFRVRAESFPAFMKCLHINPRRMGECVIWEGKARRLVIRYCDDQFGEGIDCRYWAEKDQYSGWEKRGLRLSLSDFEQVKDAVTKIDPFSGKLINLPNIFADRKIKVTNKRTASPGFNKDRSEEGYNYINDKLLKILDEE